LNNKKTVSNEKNRVFNNADLNQRQALREEF
jgi:hypothetical protein